MWPKRTIYYSPNDASGAADPAAGAGDAESRIQALIRERNAARSDLQEAKAEIAELTEAVTTAKAATDAAVSAAKGEAATRIAELETKLRLGTNRELLLADKIPADQLDEMLDYLDYQFSKAKPAEGQTEKPSFADWYAEARKTNKVLRAAMKPSVREAAAGAATGDEADPAKAAADKAAADAAAAEAAKKKVPAVIPPKGNLIPPKAGDTGAGLPDMSKIKIGTPEYAAAKEKARKLAFAGR